MDEANLARLTPSIDETIVATRRLPRMSISRVGPLDVICFLLVGTYLSVVFVFLLLTKRLRPEASLRRIARAAFRRRQSGTLETIYHDGGHCYRAPIDSSLISEDEGWSRVVLCEDGKPLSHPHAPHDVIRKKGRGAYSHWAGMLYFSSSDNSDPCTNGRPYRFAEV